MTGLHTVVLALALTGAGTDEPVLLDFSAPWCGPCRQMDPVIDRLIANGYAVKKLDFDRDRELARKFGVDRIPCFVMTVGGRETALGGQIEALEDGLLEATPETLASLKEDVDHLSRLVADLQVSDIALDKIERLPLLWRYQRLHLIQVVPVTGGEVIQADDFLIPF